MKGWIDEWKDGMVDRWNGDGMDELTHSWTDAWMDRWMER